MATSIDDLRYPVGKWKRGPVADAAERAGLIQHLVNLPAAIGAAVAGLSDTQLDTPYRPDGWTPRQIVHHVADSHMNAYIRFKLGMTEDNPTIKPYKQDKWAETVDSKTAPLSVSLPVLAGVHDRMVRFLKSMSASDFGRTIFHPENGSMTLDELLGLYAWHSQHHTAHITELRKRSGW
jgi:uncharacterized damage-inducible protein DinB